MKTLKRVVWSFSSDTLDIYNTYKMSVYLILFMFFMMTFYSNNKSVMEVIMKNMNKIKDTDFML